MSFSITDDARECLVFACVHVLDGETCRLVTHYKSDSTWEFMCGRDGHNPTDAVIVSAGELVDSDPTIADAMTIEPDYMVTRSDKNSPWIAKKMNEEIEKK